MGRRSLVTFVEIEIRANARCSPIHVEALQPPVHELHDAGEIIGKCHERTKWETY